MSPAVDTFGILLQTESRQRQEMNIHNALV
jgi:hypothetical protein